MTTSTWLLLTFFIAIGVGDILFIGLLVTLLVSLWCAHRATMWVP